MMMRRTHLNRALTACFAALAVSCSTKQKNMSEPVAPPASEIVSKNNDRTFSIESDGVDAFADVDPDDGEIDDVQDIEGSEILEDAEFCKDNIYAQYLKDEYLRLNTKAQNPEKAFKPTKRSRRRVATRSPYNQREVEALFYARSRLVGSAVPYFGAIPVVTNPRVEHWIRYFKNSGKTAFLRWLVRGESVRNVVLPILKEQGMPPEFIFLSMVESGFSNSAYSRARATGPWQFMPATGKLYGLQMNRWIDERRDPAKSTLAAARLLSDLYKEFGDWYLAMAAYNAGPGRLRSAMRKTGSNNFWDLADSPYLPVETKNYVPKVLAALTLSSNPVGHGFHVVGDPLDVLPVTQVEIPKPVAVRELAEKLRVPEALIRFWNPELISGITPPTSRSKTYKLRVANNLTENWLDIAQNLNYLDVKDFLVHRVRRGDTVASIANRYRVDVRNILSVNPGLSSSRLKIGTEISVPTGQIKTQRSTKAESAEPSKRQG